MIKSNRQLGNLCSINTRMDPKVGTLRAFSQINLLQWAILHNRAKKSKTSFRSVVILTAMHFE